MLDILKSEGNFVIKFVALTFRGRNKKNAVNRGFDCSHYTR